MIWIQAFFKLMENQFWSQWLKILQLFNVSHSESLYDSFIIFDAAGGDKKPKRRLGWIMETKRTNLTVSTG